MPGKKVLIVDDIPMNCKVLAMHLSKYDIPCDIATNGEQAVTACMRTRYTVVLMDLDMPVMDGVAATKLIRKYEEAMEIRTPILAVTSFDKPIERQRCIRQGLDGLVKKGITAEELFEVINSYHLEDTGSRIPANVARRAVSEHLSMSADMAQLEQRFPTKTVEMLLDFVQFAKGMLEELEIAIADRDSVQLTHFAYALKGSCSSLGLITMADLCAEISDDGNMNRWHRVGRKYRTLKLMLYTVSQRVNDDCASGNLI